MEALNGKYFHSMKAGEIEWQGVVIEPGPELTEVQLFSWICGGPTDRLMIETSELLNSERFRLYPDRQAMIEAYARTQSDPAEFLEAQKNMDSLYE